MRLGDNVLVHLCIPARATSLRLMRPVVSRAAELAGVNPEQVERLVLAVNEAGMNVIQHAYGETRDGDLELAIRDEGDDLVFVLIDHAPPIALDRIQGRDLRDVRPGGLGVHFINEIMDRIDYSHLPDGQGNRLEMRKRIR
ncbi:MAG: ATP-binding protein [Gammaproteobacteria bacterium]|nr:ATP-binding protein [Gammaproteobacteria bacterium]